MGAEKDPIKGPLDLAAGQARDHDKGINMSQGGGRQKEKVHRVRITNREIQAIAEGLRLLWNLKAEEAKEKGTMWLHGSDEYEEVKFLQNLAYRFKSWGTPYPGYERPYYARPRRS